MYLGKLVLDLILVAIVITLMYKFIKFAKKEVDKPIKKHNIGVIIGRFQVPELHEGHKKLINEAFNENDELIFLIGETADGTPDDRNPYSFIHRIKLLSQEVTGKHSYRQLVDRNDDQLWSNDVDSHIISLMDSLDLSNINITLYHGRDSFKDHYLGSFKTKEIESVPGLSGTEIRNKLKENKMNSFNPLLLTDSYKVHHKPMYPDNMTKLYSNGTCRKSRFPNIQHTVVFGIQHFILQYLIHNFNRYFFHLEMRERLNDSTNPEWIKCKEDMIAEYKRHNPVDTTHIEALWDLGYLPIEIKSLDEGTLCPIGVPMFTITNTHPDHGWLVNYLETLISCCIWQAYTSATLAYEFRKLLNKYAMETTGSTEGVQWQGHDFAMRGMSSPESAILSGMGHLLSFTGTDTIPAIYQLERSYDATGLIGASVPATEHSVMCMGTKEAEVDTFRRLLSIYPTGILSVVSDTWNLWTVLTDYLPQLKEEILARDGKLVIRPDSGDPVDIICGTFNTNLHYKYKDGFRDKSNGVDLNTNVAKGVIELLWDIFGGTVNEQGYKVLDSHIGAIYGDSINMERAEQICERLKAKGFASTNVVLGIGSFTYQYNTRDTFGFAMKATYGELTHENTALVGTGSGPMLYDIEPREIFKDPITDDGTKKSKKGLLWVGLGDDNSDITKPPIIVCEDQQTWEEERTGLLTTVFKDGVLVKRTTLDEIRGRLAL